MNQNQTKTNQKANKQIKKKNKTKNAPPKKKIVYMKEDIAKKLF